MASDGTPIGQDGGSSRPGGQRPPVPPRRRVVVLEESRPPIFRADRTEQSARDSPSASWYRSRPTAGMSSSPDQANTPPRSRLSPRPRVPYRGRQIARMSCPVRTGRTPSSSEVEDEESAWEDLSEDSGRGGGAEEEGCSTVGGRGVKEVTEREWEEALEEERAWTERLWEMVLRRREREEQEEKERKWEAEARRAALVLQKRAPGREWVEERMGAVAAFGGWRGWKEGKRAGRVRRREGLVMWREEIEGLMEEGYRRPPRRNFEVSVRICRGFWEVGVRWGYTVALYHRGEWGGRGMWGRMEPVKMGVWDEEEGFWAGRENGGEDERLCRRLESAFRKMVEWWREKLGEAEIMGEGKKLCRHPDVDFWRVRATCLPRWRAMRAKERREREERRAEAERERREEWMRRRAAGPKWALQRELERRMERELEKERGRGGEEAREEREGLRRGEEGADGGRGEEGKGGEGKVTEAEEREGENGVEEKEGEEGEREAGEDEEKGGEEGRVIKEVRKARRRERKRAKKARKEERREERRLRKKEKRRRRKEEEEGRADVWGGGGVGGRGGGRGSG